MECMRYLSMNRFRYVCYIFSLSLSFSISLTHIPWYCIYAYDSNFKSFRQITLPIICTPPQWSDISFPFHECNVRIRIFESCSGYDTFCGELVVPLTSIDSDLFKESKHNAELGLSKLKIKYKPILHSSTNKLQDGEIEGIFPLGLSHADMSQLAHRRLKSYNSVEFKNRKFDRLQNSEHLHRHRRHLKPDGFVDEENVSVSSLHSNISNATDHHSILTDSELSKYQYTSQIRFYACRAEKDKSKLKAEARVAAAKQMRASVSPKGQHYSSPKHSPQAQ
jgi:hypothetical protein